MPYLFKVIAPRIEVIPAESRPGVRDPMPSHFLLPPSFQAPPLAQECCQVVIKDTFLVCPDYDALWFWSMALTIAYFFMTRCGTLASAFL